MKGKRAVPQPKRALSVWVIVVAVGLVFGGGLGTVAAGIWPFSESNAKAAPLYTFRTSDYHSLLLHPQEPNTLFFGHHIGVLKSTDGGRTWQNLPVRGDAMALATHASAPKVIYLAGHLVFLKSSDGGETWTPVSNDLPHTDIHGFTVHPGEPQTLFAFVVGYGLFRSSDGGSRWQLLSRELPNDVMGLAALEGTPPLLFAASMAQGVLRSPDGGLTWERAQAGLPSRNVTSLAVARSSPETLWAGTLDGLIKTADRGRTWEQVAFPEEGVATLAVSSGEPPIVWAIDGRGRLFRSNDGGESW